MNHANDIALGAGSLTAAAVATKGVKLNDVDYVFAGATPTSTVSVGSVGKERTITNVAAGRLSASSTDAVNGSQLYATNSAVTNIKNTGTKYFHANSTGADSQASGPDAVAIGTGAVANHANDIALGAGSLTAATVGTTGIKLNDVDYEFAGATPTSTLSVGSVGKERTITNVAAGRLSASSTDAVNGSQLYATNSAVTNIKNTGTKYFHANSTGTDSQALGLDAVAIGMGAVANHVNDIALGAGSLTAATVGTTGIKLNDVDYEFAGATPTSTLSVGSVGKERTITNVAAGRLSASSTDAVNGSQLYATNSAIENIANTGTKYFHANSTGTDSQALGLDAVAIGMGAVANHANDIALGAGSLTAAAVGTTGIKLNDVDYVFAGATPTSTVSVGSLGNERTITNVAAGRLSGSSTDAVNGSQLFATNSAVTNIYKDVGNLKQDALLWDPLLNAFSASHGSSTVNKITNVAEGELSKTSTDAVNGSQLYATNQKVESIDNRVTNIENNVVPTMRYLKVNSTGANAVASGTDAIALGQGAVASGDNAIATGNGAQASGNGAIATGNNASASGTGSVAIGDNATVTANNSVALGAGSVADRDNSVSVGSSGNERQITNVAAGTEDTDAVNVAQLKQVSGDVTNISNDVTNISNGKDGMFQVNNTSNYAKPVVTGSDAVAGGAGSSASGSNSMAVGTKSSASGESSVALGNHSSATAKNSVALGASSVADRENSVSVGYAGAERQITNVAAGTASTDAVNVSQLKQGITESNQYTNKQFNNLKNMLDDQKDKLSAGIAGAMAMATLPQPYFPGASMVGLSGGTYQGESAVALGLSTISDNGKWVTKFSGTTTSQGDLGASIGIGYQW
nr:YadA family autotransporter adhesin [Pragia fontium]